MASWIYLALIGGVASNLASFISRKAVKDEDPTAFAWWFELIRTLAFVLLAFFNYKLILSVESLKWLLMMGLTEIVAIYFFLKQQRYTELSVASIIMRLRIVWAPLLAFFAFGEKLVLGEYMGIMLILLGLIIILISKKLRQSKGIKFALGFSVLAALMAILMKSSSQFASTPVVLIFMSSPSVLVFPLLMKKAKKRLISSFNHRIKNNLMFLSVNIVSMYLYTEALRVGPASKVVAIYQSMMIVAVILGILVLNEKERIINKIVGTLLTLSGILLLV